MQVIIRVVVICFICRGRHFFLGDNNVTSRIFRIPVDPGLAGLVANILTGLGYGSVLVFSVLDINSGLASKWVTSTLCWQPWVAVDMVLASIGVDVYHGSSVFRCMNLAAKDEDA
ncbi:hypothetical protein Taro_041014 [Colocasia esculenta]|uniref:Uncharacterized protein n=1 Tax=Colocasia esculenta TaxID=4460 RepID=A0A843WEP1_COLES|nr:hypothetical protein [Colocasia esculenta]